MADGRIAAGPGCRPASNVPVAQLNTDARSGPRPRVPTHGWFAVIWLICLIDYADRFAISAVLPAIQQEFALNDAQLGSMSGSLFLGLAALAVPCGIAVDRFSRKYMVSLMTVVWSIATWSTGLASSFAALVGARIVVGAGEAGYNPAGYALIAAWYPQRKRGTMIGLFQMAQPFGSGLGIMLGGLLAARFGWRAVFGVLALPGILLALAMLFAPDYKTRRIDTPSLESAKPCLAETWRFIAGNRTLQLIYFAQFPITLYVMAIAIWGPTLFVRGFQMSVAEAASTVGLIAISGGFGAAVGGWLSDRVSRDRPAARVSICLLFLAVPLVLHGVALLGTTRGMPLQTFVACYGLGQFFLAANWGTLVAAGLDLSPPPHRATAQSLLPMFQAIAAVCAGVLSGVLSDRIGLSSTILILLVAGMISGMLLLIGARACYERDYERQDALGRFSVDLG